MPPRKKQKTAEDSSAPVGDVDEVERAHDDAASESGDQSAEDAAAERLLELPPYIYITMPVPENEFSSLPEPNDEAAEDEDEDEEYDPAFSKFKKVLDDDSKNGRLLKPASEFKDRKWVILNEAWKMFCDFRCRSDYCNPDAFHMYVYNDFEAYGTMELLENLLVLFNLMRKKKDEEEAQWGTWAVLSAMAMWLDAGRGSDFTMVDDGDRAVQLATLTGTAVLTGLTMVERAGELKPDSKFLDLGIVISTYLRWALDNGDVCMEDETCKWHQDIVGFFERSGLDTEKGVTGTKERLVKLKGENPSVPGTKKDAWGWEAKLKEYKKDHVAGRMGGHHFDITKWSRKDRARHAFSGKDPLAEFSAKDLKENMLELNR